jgi:hypothetical protein
MEHTGKYKRIWLVGTPDARKRACPGAPRSAVLQWYEPTLSQRRVNLSRQAGGPSTHPSEALRTRPEPPSLSEGWRAKVEFRYGEEHEPTLTGTTRPPGRG